MTTVRRVLALTALTVALAAAVGITADRSAPPARPLLVPGLRFDDLARVELEVGPSARVTIALDGEPRITAPVAAAADELAVRDLVSSVAAARLDRLVGDEAWRRAGLDGPAAVLRLRRRTGVTTELRVGAPVAASGQTWIAVDRRVGLVPAWVADTIVRDPDSLRRRDPFPAPATVTAVELHGAGVDLVLAGDPLRRRDPGVAVALDPVRRGRLLERLAALAIVIAVDAPRPEPDLTIRVLGGSRPAELTAAGSCPGRPELRLVETTIGVGCVAAADLDEVLTLARELTTPAASAHAPIERFDRTTVAALELEGPPPVRLEPDGAGWRLTVGGRVFAADRALVGELADSLTAEASVASLAAAASWRDRPAERWRLRRPSGEVEVWHVSRGPNNVSIRRAGEPIELVLGKMAPTIFRVVGAGLRDRSVLAIDPVAVAAIAATGQAAATVERGALMDEWRAIAPAGEVDAPAILALRDRLAALRAIEWLEPRALGPVRRTLVLAVDDGPGDRPRRRVVLEVGAAGAHDCAVRIDGGDVARLGRADCAALRAPLVAAPARRR